LTKNIVMAIIFFFGSVVIFSRDLDARPSV